MHSIRSTVAQRSSSAIDGAPSRSVGARRRFRVRHGPQVRHVGEVSVTRASGCGLHGGEGMRLHGRSVGGPACGNCGVGRRLRGLEPSEKTSGRSGVHGPQNCPRVDGGANLGCSGAPGPLHRALGDRLRRRRRRRLGADPRRRRRDRLPHPAPAPATHVGGSARRRSDPEPTRQSSTSRPGRRPARGDADGPRLRQSGQRPRRRAPSATLAPTAAELDLPVDEGSCARSLSASIGYRDPRGIPVFESASIAGRPKVELDGGRGAGPGDRRDAVRGPRRALGRGRPRLPRALRRQLADRSSRARPCTARSAPPTSRPACSARRRLGLS